ncbi:S-adenosyl-L-methionine-dependent methyltransferase [Poronia punctata]|nr:S-adenosyl-L-methionine-dependent methyltransferase [Poronia punctata]
MAKLQEELKALLTQSLPPDQVNKLIQGSERIMRKPASLLLSQAGIINNDNNQPFTLLDHACGTGPIAAEIQENIPVEKLLESKIFCADISESLIGVVKKRKEILGWVGVETGFVDAMDSKFQDESFSHVTVNFGMHIFPEPNVVLRDIHRILKPSGIFAFTTWHKDNQGWIPDMLASLPFEDVTIPPMALNGKKELVDPDLVAGELIRAGFVDVKVDTVEHLVRVESAEDFVSTFEMMRDWVVGNKGEEMGMGKDVLDEYMVRYLREKYAGQGWDTVWKALLVTCRKAEQ